MYTTIEEVKDITGYDVTKEQVRQAQFIIESYSGRSEAMVNSPGDRALLNLATAYQAAYIATNSEIVFEQASVTYLAQFGQAMSFDANGSSPYVAPLAVMACKGLSWKKMRSVKTGSSFYRAPVAEGWRYE